MKGPEGRRKGLDRGHHVHVCHNANRGVESWSIKNEVGDVVEKNIALPPEVSAFLAEILREYEERFGSPPSREMTIGEVAEKVDRPWPTQEEFHAQTAEAMRQAGMRPEFIYAFEKTGRLISEENRHLVDEKDLREWEDAIAEFRARR